VAEEIQEHGGRAAALRVRAVLVFAAGAGRVAAQRGLQDGVAGLRRGPELPAAVPAAQPAVVGQLQLFQHGVVAAALRAARRQPVPGPGAEDARLQGVGLAVGRPAPDLQLSDDLLLARLLNGWESRLQAVWFGAKTA